MASLSFRAKIIVVFVGSLLALIFMIFAGGSYYINILQKRNVEAAVALAQEQARDLKKFILQTLSEHPASLTDAAIRERVKARTEVILERNKNIVWAGIFDSAGNRILEETGPGGQSLRGEHLEEGSHTSDLQTTGSEKLTVTVRTQTPNSRRIREPLLTEGKEIGEIRLDVARTPAFQRIETTSQHITSALVAECALLLVFLLLVFWALWRQFSRQLHLMQRNAELDRMAYVGTLASGLAHEIRNPLSAMNVNLEVIREELADPAADSHGKAVELALRVQREVGQLNSILTSFLDFALPNRESFSPFSVRAMIEELIEVHGEQMRLAGITCDLISPPSEQTIIQADRRLIYQAVRNIFVNAIQAVTDGVKKQVRVTIDTPDSSCVRIAVSDSGPGITKENLSRLFELFFSTRKGGSGFGLAIARKIIEEHHGTIQAGNNPDALGATFMIRLPRKSAVTETGNAQTEQERTF